MSERIHNCVVFSNLCDEQFSNTQEERKKRITTVKDKISRNTKVSKSKREELESREVYPF